jgi:general secretion pathway protein A
MSYYNVLGLDKEPFSTSPDPLFFYESQEHHAALLRLMVEIRLKRGLSLILGDIGTGKTTLSRKFFQMLMERPDIIFGMILDPVFDSERLFLEALLRTFGLELPAGGNILDYKDAIKRFLFQKGVEEKRTVVLLIDEGQKLNDTSLELLRGLLNYETNEFKLLQLVILAQLELLPRLREINNFWDRISLKYLLNPLDEQETRQMIGFRLLQAGCVPGARMFTDDALIEIYRYTRGYPRKIAMICHDALKHLVAYSCAVADAAIIRELIDREARVKGMAISG